MIIKTNKQNYIYIYILKKNERKKKTTKNAVNIYMRHKGIQ